MPWSERERAARQTLSAIAKDGPSEPLMALLRWLVRDPKWEVRRVVAEALEVLPEDRYEPLAVVLLKDRNRFVRTVAERSRDRRQQGQKLADRRRRSSDSVREQYAVMVERHGQKVADQAMKMSLTMYDLLVGSSVHEMRNVVTPLKAATRHLQKHVEVGAADAGESRRRLGTMIEWIATLEQLLDDMRTYTQATPAYRTPERLSDLVQQASQMAREWFEGKGLDTAGIQLDVQVPDGIVVPVSRHQMVMSFKNVIKNAIDAFALGPATFRTGTVTIRGGMRDGQAVVTVADTGMGLSPLELDELRRFVPGRTSKPHGTGYGLPTAQRRITEHGGTLTIDSVEDAGTTVVIALPLLSEGC